MDEVGGTNPLVVPGVKKLGGTGPSGPHGCCAYAVNRGIFARRTFLPNFTPVRFETA